MTLCHGFESVTYDTLSLIRRNFKIEELRRNREERRKIFDATHRDIQSFEEKRQKGRRDQKQKRKTEEKNRSFRKVFSSHKKFMSFALIL